MLRGRAPARATRGNVSPPAVHTTLPRDRARDDVRRERLQDARPAVPARDRRLARRLSDAFGDVTRDVLGLEHGAAEERVAKDVSLREALRLDETGIHRVHTNPARAQRR